MESDAYQREVDEWHGERIRRLTAPDGWLSLVGLDWLAQGVNRIGSAADNDIVLAKAPAHLGTITWTDDGQLCATSGRETYGAARFLYADVPRDGKVVLDFNKAYNPPCAFTAYATCPLAPPENRLGVRVTAGEKRYQAGH